jgi:hypothetical protein
MAQARVTKGLLTLFLLATIMVLTTASQRRNAATKDGLKTFTAKKVLSVDSSLTMVPNRAAGKKLRHLLDYCDYEDDYDCGEEDEEDTFPCDYEGDYSCLEDEEDEEDTFPCDYEGDYSCLEDEDEEDEEDTPAPSGIAPVEGGTVAPVEGGTVAPTPKSPNPSGAAPAGTGTAVPVTTTAPATVPSPPKDEGKGTDPVSSTIPEAISSLVNGTSIPEAISSLIPGAKSSSFTAWHTHGAHYTTCVTGFTIALAFFTNAFF